MAEEETVAAAAAEVEAVASPPPSDHKRKLEDLDSEEAPKHETSSTPPSETPLEPIAEANDAPNGYQIEEEISKDSPEAKRPRLDEETNGSAADAGQPVEEVEVPHAEKSEQPAPENVQEAATEVSEQADSAADVSQAVPQDENLPPSEQPVLSQQENLAPEADLSGQDLQTTCKIEVPNNKVGVLIGKAGDTIRFLQFNSGARIQITRDADADPYSSTRPVELIGTVESINKAEKLIKDVIAEADAGGSPSLVARGFGAAQTGSEQIQIQVPYEKVGLIIGKGGETIKNLQTKTGARIQVILQNLPEGDTSKERTIRVTGTKDQIQNARELIKDVLSQLNPMRPSPLSGRYSQQTHRPRGPSGPSQWGARGPPPVQPTSYDQQRGMYPTQSTPYPQQGYSGYPHQQASRGVFSQGWDQRHPAPMQAPPQSGSYGYYGQGGYAADAPSATASVPPVAAASTPTGHAPSHMNYNYGQPQGAMQPPYSQPAPQQSYGHGYDNPKYDNQAPPQQSYGVHGGQPGPYPTQGTADSGYMQQSYGGRPAYGMPSQGPSPQLYGPPRAAQPADMPYQGSISSSHMQGSTGPSHQPYPYSSGGPPQQPYPYASASAATDGYAQPNPVPAAAPYAQPGGQPPPVYTQGGQPAPVYPQAAGAQPASGYGQQGAQPMPGYAQPGGQYPASQPAYGEQQAPNNVNYGYQGSGDTGYNSMPYGAPPGGQTGYMQPAPNQPSYEQPQSGYSGATGTPAGYAKNVSPQPGYTQYEAGQAYGSH